jgi:hypothetical protein
MAADPPGRDGTPLAVEGRSEGSPRGAGPGVVARGFAALLLRGLTSMELIALAVAYVGAVAFAWVAGLVPPERLITQPSLRAGWALVVLSLLRPLTWLPFVVVLIPFRRLFDALVPDRSRRLRNSLAGLATLAVLAGVGWLVLATFEHAATTVASVLAFLTARGRLEDLGNVPGDWGVGWVAVVAAGVLLIRVGLPPLDGYLGLSEEPILGFVSGARGRFDRIALFLSAAIPAVAVGVGYLIGRT